MIWWLFPRRMTNGGAGPGPGDNDDYPFLYAFWFRIKRGAM